MSKNESCVVYYDHLAIENLKKNTPCSTGSGEWHDEFESGYAQALNDVIEFATTDCPEYLPELQRVVDYLREENLGETPTEFNYG